MIRRRTPSGLSGWTASRRRSDRSGSPDLSASAIWFHAESERSRHDRLILVDSKYSQPFGTFRVDRGRHPP